MKLYRIKKSNIDKKGRGLYATQDIKAGTKIINYVGKLITKKQTEESDYNNIGSDILYYDKNINQKTREKVMLESGDYTFRLQQGNSANASYSFIVYLD